MSRDIGIEIIGAIILAAIAYVVYSKWAEMQQNTTTTTTCTGIKIGDICIGGTTNTKGAQDATAGKQPPNPKQIITQTDPVVVPKVQPNGTWSLGDWIPNMFASLANDWNKTPTIESTMSWWTGW